MPARPSAAQPSWILIPVHNRVATTRSCLLRLNELGVPAWAEVLVADDGSTDETAMMLRSEFPRVRVLQGDGGWWWAGAIRAGMEEAARHQAQAVCWLNDDTLPDPGALEKLFALASQCQGICGGLSRTDPTVGMTYSGGSMRRRWPAQNPPCHGGAPVAVEWLHGNMVVVPSAVWQKLGLPNTCGTIHNFADIEYTYAAYRQGISVRLMPEATAMANANCSASYRSWRDDSLSWQTVWRGFFNPKVWWYLPGLVAFKMRSFGIAGLGDCCLLVAKAAMLPLYKMLKKLPGGSTRSR